MRNLVFLSPFKAAIWSMFVLTSVPIHLVFNSAIFEISNASGTWTMTLAAESFASGAPFYLPGASLLNGNNGNDYKYFQKTRHTKAIQYAATNASGWTKLDTDTCRTYIDSCRPRKEYGDIVIVMTSDNTTSFTADGWIPGQSLTWQRTLTCPTRGI